MRNQDYLVTPVRDRLGERAYDAHLGSQPTADFMQTLAWGRVKSLTGWRSHPLLLQDREGGVAGTALVLTRKIPAFPGRLAYAPRGPVLDWTLPADRLFAALRAFAAGCRRLLGGAVLLKCDPPLPAGNQAARRALTQAGFRPAAAGLSFEALQPRFVYEIDVRPPAERLIASFASKHRYNIRLAGRKGVSVRQGPAMDDMAAFYRLLQVTATRDGFAIRSWPYYEAIWREVVGSGGARLYLAEHGGALLAGALIFTLGGRAWYVYGASSNERRNLMPNYALHWHIIGELKKDGIDTYDMRGISGDFSPDNPLYGLYRFKKGFTGQVVEYAGEFDLPLTRPLYWAVRLALPAYRALRRAAGGGRRRGRPDTAASPNGAPAGKTTKESADG